MTPPRSSPAGPLVPTKAPLLVLIALCALTAPVAHAGMDLVVLPAPDQLQLTIYNSEDLTLARESRRLMFAKGANKIQFSWAGTLIDPTSPRLDFKQQNADFQILDITYPAGAGDRLIWNVEARETALADIEITYFISGVTWQADCVGRANESETEMSLEGFIRVTNRSGEDFRRAQVRVVVGTVNLVDKIADLARQWLEQAAGGAEGTTVSTGDVWRAKNGNEKKDLVLGFGAVAATMDAPMLFFDSVKEVLKQAVSEYQLYTIEGTEDLPDQWSKRLRSFSEGHVKIEVTYELNEEKHGADPVKLYTLKNDAEHGLGNDPIPAGVYRLFREIGGGDLAWAGQHEEKYVPLGEKMELFLGPDGLVTMEARRMSLRRMELQMDPEGDVDGWDQVEEWILEVKNSRPNPVPLKITRFFDGKWEFVPSQLPPATTWRKVDQRTVEIETKAPGASQTQIPYRLTTRFGTRAD